MTPVEKRARRRTTVAIKEALRELSVQLSLVNLQVSGRLAMRHIDLDCLDLIGRHGPLSPTALARLAGLHAATLTGILDRLEKAGWIARDRDPSDRRAVLVRVRRERAHEVFAMYAGLNAEMDGILDGYDDRALAVLDDFLRRCADVSRKAAAGLAAEPARDSP
jgi:DNA-binding MarR family transcriptional regulator